MLSIRWKLVFIYVALIFFVLILTGSFIILSFRSNEESKAEIDLKGYADQIKEQVIGANRDVEDFQGSLQSFRNYQSAIINTLGATVASSVVLEDGAYPSLQSSVIISAMRGEESFVPNRKHPDANDKVTSWMEYARPVFNADGAVEYIIYVRSNANSIYENIASTTNTFVLAIFMALLLTGVLGVAFSGTITGPISLLTSKAKELARGNLDQKIEVQSKDEIGQLTESFNNMASELKKTIGGMQTEKSKLEIVLYNMTDGVLAYDMNGVLIHANQACEELLGTKDIYTMDFAALAEYLYPGAKIGPSNFDTFRDGQITVGGKFLSLSLNSYTDVEDRAEGIVIVIQDITKHKKLDDMRKDFVANVSHEIRTPLTNIKSYAETLMEGAIENKELAVDFLGVINGEVDRMTHIVKDLLELSSLDNDQLVLDISPVNVNELIKETIKQHIMSARKQNKDIQYHETKEDICLYLDRQRISQVLTNIITNSLKYSYEGCVVEIRVELSRQYTMIFIKDNGMGIPKEDLHSIFDRFYRVDKARSRALGGTGLGLSIAKEIVEAHGGRISAVSEVNKGTTMILRFPCKPGEDGERVKADE